LSFSILHQIRSGRNSRLAKGKVDSILTQNMTTGHIPPSKITDSDSGGLNQSFCEKRYMVTSSFNKKKKRKRKKSKSVSKRKFIVKGNSNADNKSLYVKNMEYLMKSTKNSLMLKQYKNFEKKILAETDHFDILEEKYYFSKLLEGLLMRKIDKLAKSFIQHFSLNCQSLLYIKTLETQMESLEEQLNQKMITLPETKCKRFFKKNFFSQKNFDFRFG